VQLAGRGCLHTSTEPMHVLADGPMCDSANV